MDNNIQFVTIHTVSTNNGRREILEDDIELALSMVEARDQANRVWLKESFQKAKKAGAKAVIIITQADPTAADAAGTCGYANKMQCDAFKTLRAQLKHEAKNFSDKKGLLPVLYIHGDTNPYCMDSKFGGKTAPNLIRLNAWGDFQEPADATVVTVDFDKKNPFGAKTLLGNKVPSKTCR
jgi:hypothetical protein